MKRIISVVLTLMLVISCVPAHAGWVTLALNKEKLNNIRDMTASKEKMISVWGAGLSAANELYGNMLWALDYIEAWVEGKTWDDLVKARTACILIAGYLNGYEFPEMALTAEEQIMLADAGYATEILMDYSRPASNGIMMQQYFRDHMLPSLDTEAIWLYELESIRDLAAVLRSYLQIECQYLCLTTNYLYLPVIEQENDGERLWATLQESYPVIFPKGTVWESDAAALEKANIEIVFASDSNLEEIDAVLQRINAKLQNVIMDMEDGIMPEELSIVGQPNILPVPLWYDTELAGFVSFRYNEDKTLTYPVCGDVLEKEDCNIYLQQTDISLEQVEAYMEIAEPYMKAVARNDNSWTIMMEGYSVSVSWENQTVVMIFLGESSTLS